ncbi:MAG: acyl-CoA dehydrogenase family protein, partial [Gammaproteobacteria bacterium]
MQKKVAFTMPVEEFEDRGCDRRRRAVNGRPGIAVIVFAISTKQLADQVRVSLEAIQCLGARGYMNDSPAGRLLRDAKVYDIGGGTNEIRRWLI